MKTYKSLVLCFVLVSCCVAWGQTGLPKPKVVPSIFTGPPLNLAQHTSLTIGTGGGKWNQFSAICAAGPQTQTTPAVAIYGPSNSLSDKNFGEWALAIVDMKTAALFNVPIRIFSSLDSSEIYSSTDKLQEASVAAAHATLRKNGYLPLSSIGVSDMLPMWMNPQSNKLAIASPSGKIHPVIPPGNLHLAAAFFKLKAIAPNTKPVLCRYWRIPQNQWSTWTKVTDKVGENMVLFAPVQQNCAMELRLPDIIPGQLLTEAAEMISFTTHDGGKIDLVRDIDQKGIAYVTWHDDNPSLIMQKPYLSLVRGKLNVQGVRWPIAVVNDGPVNSKPNQPHYWISGPEAVYSVEKIRHKNTLKISASSGEVKVYNDQQVLVRTIKAGQGVVLSDVPLLESADKDQAVTSGLPKVNKTPQKLSEKPTQTYDKPEGEMDRSAVKDKYFNPLKSGLNFYTAKIDDGQMDEDDEFEEEEREAYFVIKTAPQAQGHKFRIEITQKKYEGVLWSFDFTWPADSERQTIRFNPVSLREKTDEENFLASLYFNGKLVAKYKFEVDD